MRAIAEATDTSRGTVARELAGVPEGTPGLTLGADGKHYPSSQPAKSDADAAREADEIEASVHDDERALTEEGMSSRAIAPIVGVDRQADEQILLT